MAPTRVGIIGLSSRAWWAKAAHLPYLKNSPDYLIVAVCSSSVANAKQTISECELGDEVRAYDDVEALAQDGDVDLVVCSVNVANHASTISPSLKTGKNVYVEWPLGKSLADAEGLLNLKNKYGVKLANVGLQAREAPMVHKAKQLIADGKIGTVLSSTWSAAGLQLGGDSLGESMAYFSKKDVGGNLLTIHFGHAIDYVQAVLGYGFSSPPNSLLAVRRPTVKLISDKDGSIIDPSFPTETPDTIFFHGTLATASIPLSMTLRGGPSFPGTPGLDWRILGTLGELRITASGPFIQIGYDDLTLDMCVDGKVENVVIDEEDIDGIPHGNIGRVYRVLREGTEVCSFEDAVERHRLLEGMLRENGMV